MSKLTKLVRSLERAPAKPTVNQDVAQQKPFADATKLGCAKIYWHEHPADANMLNSPIGNADSQVVLNSCLCTEHQLSSPAFRYWIEQIGESWRLHRKLWEFAYVLQALYERGMLTTGRKGLGFAVGEEPLPSFMASLGCEVLASDLHDDDERAIAWADTAQLASNLTDLNRRGLCDEALFRQRVSFQPIDMNKIPDDINGYDYTWSSCSFEHCGSIGLGKRFIREQMRCLKPGGVAVHTTEYNLSSNEETVDSGSTVIFRRQDIEGLIRDLRADGHAVEPLQLHVGNTDADQHIDPHPYGSNKHLKLELYNLYASTSIGLIIKKDGLKAESHSSSGTV